MFWKNYDGWRLNEAQTTKQRCVNCSNTGEHFVYVVPRGLQLGLVFLKKPLVGLRKYYLACPVCGYLAKELTKSQVVAMKG